MTCDRRSRVLWWTGASPVPILWLALFGLFWSVTMPAGEVAQKRDDANVALPYRSPVAGLDSNTPHLRHLRAALKTGKPAEVTASVQRIPRSQREAHLIHLIQILPSSPARNGAIVALGEFGSFGAYGELRRELLRPRWTDEIDLIALSTQLRRTDANMADRLFFLAVARGSPERHRPEYAARAIMVLSGYIPGKPLDANSSEAMVKVAREFDSAMKALARRDRTSAIASQVKGLLSIVCDPTESNTRVSMAIWVLSRYAGHRTKEKTIEIYSTKTDPAERSRRWNTLRDSLGKVAWDPDVGHAVGLEGVGLFIMKEVGF